MHDARHRSLDEVLGFGGRGLRQAQAYLQERVRDGDPDQQATVLAGPAPGAELGPHGERDRGVDVIAEACTHLLDLGGDAQDVVGRCRSVAHLADVRRGAACAVRLEGQSGRR